jgi:hypothetical protein
VPGQLVLAAGIPAAVGLFKSGREPEGSVIRRFGGFPAPTPSKASPCSDPWRLICNPGAILPSLCQAPVSPIIPQLLPIPSPEQ